jgi:hypothetical protein
MAEIKAPRVITQEYYSGTTRPSSVSNIPAFQYVEDPAPHTGSHLVTEDAGHLLTETGDRIVL